MKKIFLFLVSFFIINNIIAQEKQLPKLSPQTMLYIEKSKSITSGEHVQGYVYKNINDKLFLSALIKVSNSLQTETLDALGIHIGTKAGNIWTAQIPIESVEAFIKLNGIEYIELNEPCFPTLDSARKATRIDSVHAGYALPQKYSGDGVVVGVVDAGFDYSHPALFDTNGNGFRVKKVWEQKSTGIPPSGFSYGNEMTDSLAMWAKGTDNGQTHATHVAGICGGSGVGSNVANTRFRGGAYKSDFVFVGITPDQNEWINTGVSDMIDGINYIFTYAASVSKPAVVNLSWGSPLGPHDGTGLFSQALDNLTGAGKIFVCSAGNNGDSKIHIKKTFTPTDTMVSTFLDIAASPVGKKTWVDVWGDTAKTFCVQIKLYNGNTAIDSSIFICLDNTIHHTYMIGSNNDTCFVDITTSSAEFNLKPRIFLVFYSKVSDKICINLKGTTGKINMWNSFVYNTTGYYGSFDNNAQTWAVDGTTDMTISDIASSKSAVTVGAYASKVTFKNTLNNTYSYTSYVSKNDLVPFSSRGPTSDGRVKPDIIGPGLTVGSAISSYDTSFLSTGTNYVYAITNYHKTSNNRDYTYGVLSGTSMSSPAVSGIVGLMLQVKSNLTPQQVKSIFTETAITDTYTGTIQPGGNNDWGNGKVNAYGAIKKTVDIKSGIGNFTNAALNFNIYPNPNNGDFTVEYNSLKEDKLKLEVLDITGHLVIAKKWDVHEGYNNSELILNKISEGFYFVKLSSLSGVSMIKMLVE